MGAKVLKIDKTSKNKSNRLKGLEYSSWSISNLYPIAPTSSFPYMKDSENMKKI